MGRRNETRYTANLKVESTAETLDAALALVPGIIASERMTDPVVHVAAINPDPWDLDGHDRVWHVRVDGTVPARPWKAEVAA
jgi:hypothetical protein